MYKYFMIEVAWTAGCSAGGATVQEHEREAIMIT